MKFFYKIRLFVTIALFSATMLVIFANNSFSQEERVLYIVSVNDQHGNIDNYPQFAALLDSLRSVYPDLLLISAGDNRTGHPVNDKYPQPSFPIVKLMNEVGFNLSTLGNHEFDAGVDALKNVVGWSNFDYVCANAKFEDSINILPYKIIDYQGLKLGFIGGIQVSDSGRPDFHSKHANKVSFRRLHEVLPYYKHLREECDALFLISHCGFEYDVKIASTYEIFDAIFGGHSHKKIERTKLIGNTMITQSGKNLNYLTISVFYFTNGKIDYKAQQVFSIKDFPKRSSKIQALVDEFSSLEIFSKVVGYNPSELDKSGLGKLMADAIRWYGKADIGLQNDGGVRLNKMPVGSITLKQVYQLDPFDNEVIKLRMTGTEIKSLFVEAYSKDKEVPLYCSGLECKLVSNEYEEFVDVELYLPSGKPLQVDKKYNIVINSYLASEFGLLNNREIQVLDKQTNSIIEGYLQKYR